MAENFAKNTSQELYVYYSSDRFGRKPVSGEQKTKALASIFHSRERRPWMVAVGSKNEGHGDQKCCVSQRVANGSEGTVVHVRYTLGPDNIRIAECAYVRIPGCGLQAPGLPLDVVPITPVRTAFTCESRDGSKFAISRYQLPLVPSYAYTDYKSQGRGLQRAIAHLDSCKSLQSLYVMLSRDKTLAGLGILTSFKSNYVEQHQGATGNEKYDLGSGVLPFR